MSAQNTGLATIAGAKPERRYPWIWELPPKPHDLLAAGADLIPSADSADSARKQARTVVIDGGARGSYEVPAMAQSPAVPLERMTKPDILAAAQANPAWFLERIRDLGGLAVLGEPSIRPSQSASSQRVVMGAQPQQRSTPVKGAAQQAVFAAPRQAPAARTQQHEQARLTDTTKASSGGPQAPPVHVT